MGLFIPAQSLQIHPETTFSDLDITPSKSSFATLKAIKTERKTASVSKSTNTVFVPFDSYGIWNNFLIFWKEKLVYWSPTFKLVNTFSQPQPDVSSNPIFRSLGLPKRWFLENMYVSSKFEYRGKHDSFLKHGEDYQAICSFSTVDN